MSHSTPSVEESNPRASSLLEQKAKRAMDLIAHGKVEQGATVLLKELGGWMQSIFFRARVRRDDIEDLIQNTCMKVIASKFRGEMRASGWIKKLATQVLIDYLRSKKKGQDADKPGGQEATEIYLDDESWELIAESMADPDSADGDAYSPMWVRRCVERAAMELQQSHPREAAVLAMLAEGWSADEIAEFFSGKKGTAGAGRQRVYAARAVARDYFKHCKDD
jgi:DNA-directed RNA polymerase specialized sigma24 family protein